MKKPNLITVLILLLVILLSVVIGSCQEIDNQEFTPCNVLIVDDHTIILEAVDGSKVYTLLVENAYGIDETLIYVK